MSFKSMSSNLPFVLWLLFFFVQVCQAQTSKIFQWAFVSQVSISLPSCQELPIIVKPFNATGNTGVPPYYLMSFSTGGIPKTDLIGTDPTQLKWTVNQRVGSKMLLSVVDSTGSAGGIPASVYEVVTGQRTDCIPTNPPKSESPQSDFIVTANISNSQPLSTCQPWGITVKGGVRPYTLTLIAKNSPVVTNVTFGPDDDSFVYPNRADPNVELAAAISDFTGRWAFGTPVVVTRGSANVDCPGQPAKSGKSADFERITKAANAALAAAEQRKRSSIIAGVLVPILLILFGAAAWYFFVFRKRQAQLAASQPRSFFSGNEKAKGGDLEKGISPDSNSVDPFSTPTSTTTGGENESRILSINSFLTSDSDSESNNTLGYKRSITLSSVGISPASRSLSATSSGTTSTGPRPNFAAFPRASTRQSAKAMEAGAERSEDEIVIQHQDGGRARVTELPPPYAGRTSTIRSPTPDPE